ncbi:MAG TPA: beta-phosphoglucomutase [Pseudoflavonifractor sp.]|nr:beta-phosphoglucomutase [Pseudoflavonifractor sp.]
MLRGVIFDLDGVICFTDEYHYLAWKELADREHIYFDREINNRLRGVSRMASLEIVLERADKTYAPEEKETMAAAKNDAYRRLLMRMTPADVTEETRQTLETLRRKGMRLAIGSSSRNARLILGRIGLGEFFDAVSDGNNITHSKPDPEVFLKAAQMLGLEPEECLVVEDAQAGIQAAHDGGFHNAAMGDAAKCELAENLLESFSDLLKLC